MKVVFRKWQEDDDHMWLFQEPKGATAEEIAAFWLLLIEETTAGDYEAGLMLRTFEPFAAAEIRKGAAVATSGQEAARADLKVMR